MPGRLIARLADAFFGSAERERLGQAIDETWSDFEDQIRRSEGKALQSAWAQTAVRNLLDAEQKLASGKFEQGWIGTLTAQRAILSNPDNTRRIMHVAIALRREADKITGWRAKTIFDLICGPKGELRPDLMDDPERVIQAVALRDDYSHNNYFKIALRRRHLRQLFRIMLIAILACLVASYFGKLPALYNDTRQLCLVILFGVLGACVSVSQGLLSAEVSAKIPAQQIGAFVIWMRPAVGAAAALASLAILDANNTVNIFNFKNAEWSGVVGLLAFAAGYSERFIVGAIEKLSTSQKS
jgi:hypothetical protein